MILFALRCTHGHEFEGWFRDGSGFEAQQNAAEIACPHCGNTSVEKAVMAPRLARSRPDVPSAVAPIEMRKALTELRRQIEIHCDYVGGRFAEEARRIHYGETNPRGIYGEASREESRALADEGINFGQIPWVPYSDA
jgi:hypothetical protein